MKKISEVLKPSNNIVIVAPDEAYDLLGMRLEGRGLFIRENKKGIELSSKFLNRVMPGQFIYSRLFAWKGAFDFVRKDFEGCFVSDEFPTFDIDENEVDVKFLYYYFNQHRVWKEVEDYCLGMTRASRNRFKEEFFLNLEIDLPSLPAQKKVASKLDSIKARFSEVKKVRKQQDKEIRQLIFSRFIQITEGCERLPFSQVAPINRRLVELEPETIYQEVGARSFGKGLFDKPSFKGQDLTWQQPYWIHSGDLVFSNIKAWEGAVAAAGDAAHLKVASHRYLTYTPNKDVTSAEFLCYYFLTPEGLEILGKASPGSADRNRTLNTRFLNNIMIPVPSPEVQLEFLEFKNKMETVQKMHAATLKELDELFPALLDKAFKGEL